MKVKEIIQTLENFAPLSLQEGFDNSGLQVGSMEMEIRGALLCIDITESVIDEAIALGFNLIISHHPLIFKGLKSLTGKNHIERCIMLCIRHNIAVYAAHSNFDAVKNGVSYKMAEKLNLLNIKVLSPRDNSLSKISIFVPKDYAEQVQNAMYQAGAGSVGNYDCCSFSSEGRGSFRANADAKPFVGETGKIHIENEVKIEVIVPKYLLQNIVKTLIASHPYEEPAFDITPLENTWHSVGLGVVGELEKEMDLIDFLRIVKKEFCCGAVKYSQCEKKAVKKIALCGGSGSEFITDAKRTGADIYITGDVSYHRFFEGENTMIIADIGHFESEQFTKEIFYDVITKNFPNFAVQMSDAEINIVSVL